jgi:hypothetical protein
MKSTAPLQVSLYITLENLNNTFANQQKEDVVSRFEPGLDNNSNLGATFHNHFNLFNEDTLRYKNNDSNMFQCDNLFYSNNMNSVFGRGGMYEYSRKDHNMHSNIYQGYNGVGGFSNIDREVFDQHVPDSLLADDGKMLKKKTPRKKKKQIEDEIIAIPEAPIEGGKNKKKSKSKKTQNVNISNTNPCIINQNNYYNGYGVPAQPRYMGHPPMSNVNIDIPDPTKFMTDKSKKPAAAGPYNNIMDPMMGIPRGMPLIYYPGFMINDFGHNYYKKPNK